MAAPTSTPAAAPELIIHEAPVQDPSNTQPTNEKSATQREEIQSPPPYEGPKQPQGAVVASPNDPSKQQMQSPQPLQPPPRPLESLTTVPAVVHCLRCQQVATTRIEKHSSETAFCIGVAVCLCCSPLCAWIPCVMDDLKDVEHYCSKCNSQLAVCKHNGRTEVTARVGPANAQVQKNQQQMKYEPQPAQQAHVK